MSQTINMLMINLALLTPLFSLLFSTTNRRWEIAYVARLIGLLSALAIWVCSMLNVDINHAFPLIHFTGLTSTVFLLVHFIGFIVLNYARRNFELDPNNQRFLQWFLITLFSVMVTVVGSSFSSRILLSLLKSESIIVSSIP